MTETLPLSLLNDYLYCPRRAALKVVPAHQIEDTPRQPASLEAVMAHQQCCKPRNKQTRMTIDEAKLNDFVGRVAHDFGATMHAGAVVVGDQLGLYQALAHGPATTEELARRSQTDARSLREWLSAQAASGYVQ